MKYISLLRMANVKGIYLNLLLINKKIIQNFLGIIMVVGINLMKLKRNKKKNKLNVGLVV